MNLFNCECLNPRLQNVLNIYSNNKGRIREINTLMRDLTEVTHVLVNNNVFINEPNMLHSVNLK